MSRRGALLGLLLTAALAAGCKYESDDHRSPTNPARPFLAAETSAASVPADGLSTVELRARIDPDSSARKIRFSASLGTIIGGGGTPSSLEVTIDTEGVARAFLRSVTTLGTSLVTVTVVDGAIPGQTLEISFVPADPNSVLRFVAVPTSVLADGTTASPVTVAVAPALPGDAGRQVTVATVLGSFSPVADQKTTTVTPSVIDNTGTVLLYSPRTVGLSILSATVSGVQRTTVLTFERASPEAIRVDLDKLTVPNAANEVINVTAFLTRRTGLVSQDTRVVFEASAGRFVSQDPVSDIDGKVTAVYSPAGVVPPGTVVTLTVREEGGTVRGTVTLTVT